MNRYHVSTSQFLGQQLPCVRDADGEIVAAGCTSEDAALFAAAPDNLSILESVEGLLADGKVNEAKAILAGRAKAGAL